MDKQSVFVYSADENDFAIEINDEYVTPAELIDITMTVDHVGESWTPIKNNGFEKEYIYGKVVSFGISGKRVIGDPAQDAIADLVFAKGRDIQKNIRITIANTYQYDAFVNVKPTDVGAGGDKVGAFKVDFSLAGGEPTVTKVAEATE